VKERLLREDNLTLKSALDICRAAEVSKAQMKVMKSESVSSSSSVAAATVSGRYTSRRPPSTSSDPCCRQCGSPPHDAQQTCHAKNQTCRRCGKSNHFARMCRSKPPPVQQQQQSSHQQRRRSRSPSRRGRDRDASVNVVADGVSDLDISDCFIGVGATSNVDDAERSWWETVLINNSPVRCKLDSGAKGNVMSVGTFNELKESSKLRPTKVRLFDFSNRRSDPLGVATLTVRHKDREHQLDFFIVDGSGPTLLSCLTCSKLNLLQRVDSSLQPKPALSTDDLLREFADVFDNSLGCMPGQHHISVDPAVSLVIHALWKVPLAIQPKLKQLVDCYEEKGIIMKRDEHTEWVSILLCVEKKDGSLRVCLDPKDLNRAIQREHYATPTFEDVSAKLCGKSLFSVINSRDGFWQVQLDEESSRLCTFNTPFGRYSFCRLPFGVSSAAEVFEKKVTETYSDIDGVHIIFDDMIIATVDEEDHDRIFRALLERARAK